MAVAKEKQLQAAQEAGAQSDKRLSKRLKAQEARVQKDAEDKMQKGALGGQEFGMHVFRVILGPRGQV